MREWAIAFLDKGIYELTIIEAIGLIVFVMTGCALCIWWMIKAMADIASQNVIRLPPRLPGEKNPFLTEDGQLKAGIAHPKQRELLCSGRVVRPREWPEAPKTPRLKRRDA